VNVLSDETVAEFLTRRHKKKTELKRTTAHEYARDIELYLVPHLGALKRRDLRARHAQGIFDWIITDNERREEHRAKVSELKAAADAASEAWRKASTGTPAEKAERARRRAEWTQARGTYLAERKNLQRVTGPATMLSIKAKHRRRPGPAGAASPRCRRPTSTGAVCGRFARGQSVRAACAIGSRC
jgi:hypothetical protein